MQRLPTRSDLKLASKGRDVESKKSRPVHLNFLNHLCLKYVACLSIAGFCQIAVLQHLTQRTDLPTINARPIE